MSSTPKLKPKMSQGFESDDSLSMSRLTETSVNGSLHETEDVVAVDVPKKSYCIVM